MKKIILLFLFYPIYGLFAQNEIRKVTIDIDSYRSQLLSSPNENILGLGKTQQSNTNILLPLVDGTFGEFQMVEYSVLPTGINTDIKTYYGQKTDDASVSCRVSITKGWLVATIYTKNGIIVIEKSRQSSNINEYDVYLQNQNEFECKAEGIINNNQKLRDIVGVQNYTNGASLRTYRMAIIVTNEFYVERGNSAASVNTELAAIINSLNGLFEKEIAIRFTLVTFPSSSNVFYRKTDAIETYLQNLNIVNVEFINRYGIANYDIGHCLHTTGGGVAALASACNNITKGAGWSGSTSPSSLLIMAHEVGHQFSANHTFLGNGNNNCNDANRNLATAYEPGSGNTIMSYADLCGAGQNISGGKVPYFHTNSLQSMITYIQSGTGNTCGTSAATGNIPPIAVAGPAFIIPQNTPFTLIGSGVDANGDKLSYTWEQYDLPVANDVGTLGSSTNGVGGYPAVNSTTAPLFRSTQSSSPERVFPDIRYILNNANNPADTYGEDLPNVSRTMNFRLTVRDNRAGGGGTHCSAVDVTVDATKGPLAVTFPNGGNTWSTGQFVVVSWSVNNTDLLSPNVDIYLSVDGGKTFPYLIASNTPNDGTQSYNISANIVSTTQARIKVVSRGSATSNFFDISDANFTINTTCNAYSSYICPATDLSTTQGAASLNLALSVAPKVSPPILSKSLTITQSNISPIIGYTDITQTTCTTLSSGYYTAVFAFRVSKTGTYTLTNSAGGFLVMSVHNTNTSLSCSNFVGGNAQTGISVFPSMSVNLNECTDYYLYIFNSSNSGVHTVDFSGVGDVYELQSTPSGVAYTYAAISNTDNRVKVVSATGNFTTLVPDSYTVYGISYNNSVNPATFVGQTLSAITGVTYCLQLSINSRKITVTCASPPSAPVAAGSNRCGTGTVSLSATGCTGTYNWYASSQGGSSLGTGSPFITSSISNTTIYYVDCTVSGCTSATRSFAIATVNAIPAIPIVTGTGSCLNSPVTLTASGCAGTSNWYTALTGGALLTTGASLTGLTSSGTYFVDCTVSACVSTRASSSITIKPAAPSVAGITITSGQTATLNATGCSGTVNWYASATGTVILSVGTSYTTPALTISTTYYADCIVSSCASATRTAATVTIPACPATLTLISVANDITSGNITRLASATASVAPNANIVATNKVTGIGTRATYQAKSILLNPGFSAANGTIFRAEIGGCN